MEKDLNKLLSQLTLEEKAGLCSGQDFWHLKGVERLDIPEIMVTDGPHGLRKQGGDSDHVGINDSVIATCFPTASASASSWDVNLMEKLGHALGDECLQEEVSVILGPGANIKRSPLCGRNFEYISEDPYLTGKMAAALVNAVQSKGIGTSLKHFVANNQEYRRMTVDAIVDERSLRELYLAGFEEVIKEAQPWTVMCSYNKINGTYASDNKSIMTDILKEEWGHTGLIVTDWGAMNDRVKGIKAGLELEMPASSGVNDKKIIEAVNSGVLTMEDLDKVVIRLLDLIYKSESSKKPGSTYNSEEHHALAREIAANSIVLLKNKDNILPLEDKELVVIGEFAKTPRYQGAGSSLINPYKIESALNELDNRNIPYTYCKGYDSKYDQVNQTLIDEAVKAAKGASKVILYAGLTDDYESEGFDRTHLRLPTNHNVLIEEVAKVCDHVVLVLQNGAPVEMPWIDKVDAVVECYLGGEAGGPASIDALYGDVNPSGKLAETFPLKLEDDLASRWFGMGPQTLEYRESIYVGYRYFDSVDQPVLFPFGHGLSYTSFEYSDLSLSQNTIKDTDEVTVSFKLKNIGNVAGAEVAQVYIRDVESTIYRPEKELKGFEKVYLEAGEEKSVTVTLNKRAFAFYNVDISDWQVETGKFDILVGSSSRNILLEGQIDVLSTIDAEVPSYKESSPIYYDMDKITSGVSDKDFSTLIGHSLVVNKPVQKGEFTRNSTLGDVKTTFIGNQMYKAIRKQMLGMVAEAGNVDEKQTRMMEAIMNDMPIRTMVLMGNGMLNFEMADGLVAMMNGKFLSGLVTVIKNKN